MFVAVKGTTTFGDLPDCYGNIFIVRIVSTICVFYNVVEDQTRIKN